MIALTEVTSGHGRPSGKSFDIRAIGALIQNDNTQDSVQLAQIFVARTLEGAIFGVKTNKKNELQRGFLLTIGPIDERR